MISSAHLEKATDKNISLSFRDYWYFPYPSFPIQIIFEDNSRSRKEADWWQGSLWFCSAPWWISRLATPSPGHLSSSSLFPILASLLVLSTLKGWLAAVSLSVDSTALLASHQRGLCVWCIPVACPDRQGGHSVSVLRVWIGKGWKKTPRHKKFNPVEMLAYLLNSWF